MRRLLAVVDAAVELAGLEELTIYRTAASIPFAGRYRMIDFMLSNIVNSGISSVGIFPTYPFVSLMDHIGKGKSWDLDRRKDGLFFLLPAERQSSHVSVGAFSALEEHMSYFTKSSQEYAVVTNCFTICQLDYDKMLQSHLESGADITEAVSEGKSLKNYILSKKLLIELIRTHRDKRLISVEDVVKKKKKPYTYHKYEHTGYVAIVNSIESYFSESLALLEDCNWSELFIPERPVYTKVKDEPPTRYIKGSRVTRSLLANGSTIEGTVRDALIGRAVWIGSDTTIEKCVIMQQCSIGNNCDLSYVIADKGVHIEDGVVLRGTEKEPVVLRKGERVTKEDGI